jgi:hypothetical protein
LVTVLSCAFHNEPNFVYMMADEQARRVILPWFFRFIAIPACRLYGEIYTTKQVDGGSLCISPGSAFTFELMVRTGMQATPFTLDKASFRRCINLGARVEKVRRRLVTGPHWYLLALAVEPSTIDGDTLGGALIEPLLSRADSDRLPCYLETFGEGTLSFYEKHGFRVEGAGDIPDGGPAFWAMIRPPD